ncbi:MBL fold metallo-hydrolase [Aeromicrobium sp.]|uniref:MBL fold metallo-hydrolase n=1 Tax=Aeromicrobium sp. TaxID=1871063 RepID=UPI0028ADCD04|nr:MBL fold metallo-hydrolase [Aeromicrobium sp.]
MGISQISTGILSIQDAGTNCYLLEHAGALVFVDAGLPRTWRYTHEALRRIGRSWADVTDIVVTHAHFDHIGFAARAQREAGVTVWVHPGDHRIAAHPYRYRPGRPRLLYPLRHPKSLPVLGRMVRSGALRVPGVEEIADLTSGPLPAGLQAIATPGHTDGHCVLHLPDLGVLFTGDALVTLDPYTGRTGPRIVAQAGTKDAPRAMQSLDLIAATEANLVLTGHGPPFTQGAQAAAELARSHGVA